jgi:hypothetical protein
VSLLEIARRAKALPRRTSLDETHLGVTVSNILALHSDELAEYRADVATAPEDDPWILHDREALRRAEAILDAQRKAAA